MLTNKKTLLALSIVSALTLTACGSDNDDNVVVEPPVTPPVVTPPPVVVAPEAPAEIASLITVNVLDTKTETVVTSAVTVRFQENGVASTNVVDLDGNAVTSLVTVDGFIQFRLAEGATITSLDLQLSGAGFLDTVQTLDLSDTTADVTSAVTISPVADVVAAVVEVAVEGNSVTNDTTVTAESAEAEATAEVAMTAGTELLDESGNAVDGTGATLQVATADATLDETKTSVADLVPAGLDAADATEAATPVAVANIVMRNAAGEKIKKFSKPITIGLDIPASDSYKAGDTLFVSSYDEDKGTWTRNEHQVTLGAVDSTTGKHKVSFETDHLTVFVPARATQRCASPTAYNVTGVDGQKVTVTFRTEAKVWTGDAPAPFGVSELGRVTVRVNGEVVTKLEAQPLCNGGTVEVPVTNPFVTETATFRAVCSNDTTKVTPLSGLNVQVTGARGAQRAAGNGTGVYTMSNLLNGQAYTVKFNAATLADAKLKTIGNQSISYTAGTGGLTQDFPIQCDSVSGG
jgi:hypothetical protein